MIGLREKRQNIEFSQGFCIISILFLRNMYFLHNVLHYYEKNEKKIKYFYILYAFLNN